jgi:peptidoglycan hydrolase-like protein with peptidoglycan-binding domain
VPDVAVDAFAALETALRAAGYEPASRWAYNCRKIRGTERFSLHSYGIAIDIDPKLNKFTDGDPFAGKLQPKHVDAALAIKNVRGRSIWSWGGSWRKPDRMHFQLDQGPGGVQVDWSSVAGADPTVPAVETEVTDRPTTDAEAVGAVASISDSSPTEEEENVLKKGSRGKAVTYFQGRILIWNDTALPQHGADGDYGDETSDWVQRFQSDMGIDPTGNIDGVTAALLRGLTD